MDAGGAAADSLLERARCYALLGQRKTAIYDFSAILKERPDHVHALCGRGFTYLTLDQQKVFCVFFFRCGGDNPWLGLLHYGKKS